MTRKEQREKWMLIFQTVRNHRLGHPVDHDKLMKAVDQLRPHWPSFDLTLGMITRTMQANYACKATA